MSDVRPSEMDESPSPLLGIPAGVENVLLSFVSCGDGGLQRILNLRQVHPTTRSWVDNLPKRQADVVFARAQVAIDCDEQSVSRFLVSPPPFGVTALSLQVDALHEPEEESLKEEEASLEEEEASLKEEEASLKKEEASLKEEEASSEEEEPRISKATWNSFCAFWNLKLETLKLKTSRYIDLPCNRRLVELMDSPNLLRLKLCRSLDLRQDSLTPSFFQKVRELRMDGIHCEDSFRNQFFDQLESNSNLTVLSVSLGGEEDFLGCAKVIDRKKDDTQLQLTFDLESTTLIMFAADPTTPNDQLYRDVLGKFGASIVASRSQIRLKLSDMGDFDKLMTELLPPASRGHLFTKIESINMWTPTEESLSLMESLPVLKKLESVDTEDSSVDFDRLTFPPSLEELEFTCGFPARQRLPSSLTSLSLDDYASDVDSLVSSLNFLSGRCPELTSLTISWTHDEDESSTLRSFETGSPPFSKLRKLSFSAQIGMEGNAGDCRTALLDGFDWRSLQLNFLHLSCVDFEGCHFAVVDEEILRNLCEGPSAKTLLTIQVENEFVTPEGLPLLQKLRSLASANWKEREEREGRGGQWRSLYAPVPRSCCGHFG